MRLSPIPISEDGGGYDLAHCAVHGCTRESEIVDAGGARWLFAVPLCTQHWAQACEMRKKETIREQVKAVDKRERPTFVPGLRAIQERMAKRMAKSSC